MPRGRRKVICSRCHRSIPAEELGIDYNKFNPIERRLKDLGILKRNYTFSEIFQNKITAISSFYARFTEKANPIQQALKDANEYLRMKDYSGSFKPRLKTYDEEEKRARRKRTLPNKELA